MGRHKEIRRDQMPGPGAYVVDRTSRGLGFASNKGARIVGRPTERKVLRSEQTPGPGENYVAPINRVKGGATMKLPTGATSWTLCLKTAYALASAANIPQSTRNPSRCNPRPLTVFVSLPPFQRSPAIALQPAESPKFPRHECPRINVTLHTNLRMSHES